MLMQYWYLEDIPNYTQYILYVGYGFIKHLIVCKFSYSFVNKEIKQYTN